MENNKLDLDAIEKRAEDFPNLKPCTPLPWRLDDMGWKIVHDRHDGDRDVAIELNSPPDRDTHYAVAVCNSYPALVSLARTQQERIRELELELANFGMKMLSRRERDEE